MLSLALPVEIFLCVEPTDMRSGYDRLALRAQEHAGREVLSGGLFVFFNRRRDRVKLLYWDHDGLAVWQKRLEAGTFQLPAVGPEATSVMLRLDRTRTGHCGFIVAMLKIPTRFTTTRPVASGTVR